MHLDSQFYCFIKYNILNGTIINSKKYLSRSKENFTFVLNLKDINMKSRFLIAHKYKPLGWFLFMIGLILGVVLMISDYDYPYWEVNVFPLIGETGFLSSNPAFEWNVNNISDEIASVLLIIGGIMVAFSKTKDEDEYISKIRMESLIWATYVNYAILILAILFVFDMSFFSVLIYNMFTILLFFMVRFHYLLYKSKKVIEDDE